MIPLNNYLPLNNYSSMRRTPPEAALIALLCVFGFSNASAIESSHIFVNGAEGSDSAAGDKQHPLKSLSAAIAHLPDPMVRSVTIEWVGGNDTSTGGRAMSPDCLELMRRMKPGVRVSIMAKPTAPGNCRSCRGKAAQQWWMRGRAIGGWRIFRSAREQNARDVA